MQGQTVVLPRRNFIKQATVLFSTALLPTDLFKHIEKKDMMNTKHYDVVIVGGSYSGLAAGMALGRALKKVLIIDDGKPCNKQTPYSHNFITQDGKTPKEISTIAKQQVQKYETVEFLSGLVTHGAKTDKGFEVKTKNDEIFSAKKLIFATGVKDIMPDIKGYAECWGISVLHCPYCHGYEVRNEATGILGNGEYGYEFSSLISNWTKDLTLYTSGKSTLSPLQVGKLREHNITIIEKELKELEHNEGILENILFKDGTRSKIKALYVKSAFTQSCSVPESLGCSLSEDGYLKVDHFQKTNVPGIYVCGDNTTRLRSVANAVGMGTTAGMMLNKEMVLEEF